MANIKISAAADAGSLLSSDMLPLARSGDANAYHATMAEIATFAGVSVSSGAYGNTGRNLIDNAVFDVLQRGNGPWTATAAYTADRWQIVASGDTVSVGIIPLTDVDRASIGDEMAQNALGNNFTGSPLATSYNLIQQKIENVHRLANKTVTVSLWADASVATYLGLSLWQVFGTGGSPSAAVEMNGTRIGPLGTTLTRYSATFTVPSSAGKTLGTNGDDFTALNIWYSSGSNNATASGNVGVQTAAINVWGVQLEIGSAATPLDKLRFAIDVANCERFYAALGNVGISGGAAAGAAGYEAYTHVTLPTTMRAVPTTIQVPTVSATNCSASGSVNASAAGFDLYITSAAAGVYYATLGPISASADL